MSERQNIEWKRSWQDEYLKWVCGFANAQGGSIFIGKSDDGTVYGLPNAKRLLEDIPGKAGYIDSWGRGNEKITKACIEHGCPKPTFEITPTGVLVTLVPKFSMAPQVTQQVGTKSGPSEAHEDQVGTKSGPSQRPSRKTDSRNRQRRKIIFCNPRSTRPEAPSFFPKELH